MRIISMRAENFKRLKAVEITPDGNVIKITGKNRQGKTSVLDAIWSALQYPGTKEIRDPVRDGEKMARIWIDLGDDKKIELRIKRIFHQDGRRELQVTPGDTTVPVMTPQTILDQLIGKFTFDPLEFKGLNEKDQVDYLLRSIKLEINLEKLDNDRLKLYDERTDVNRRLRDAKGQIPDKRPEKFDKVSVTDLSNDLELLSKEDKKRQEMQAKIDNTKENIKEIRQEIARLESREKNLQKFVDELEADITKTRDVSAEIKGIKESLAVADEQNDKAKKWDDFIDATKKAEDLEKQSADLTGKIEKIDKTKTEAIAKADLPYPGLGFDDEGLTLNGHPFKQSASDSEQISVSFAIMRRLNPNLRVGFIRNGNELDTGSWEVIEKACKDDDFQVWTTIVDDTGKIGVVIEDGEVVK